MAACCASIAFEQYNYFHIQYFHTIADWMSRCAGKAFMHFLSSLLRHEYQHLTTSYIHRIDLLLECFKIIARPLLEKRNRAH